VDDGVGGLGEERLCCDEREGQDMLGSILTPWGWSIVMGDAR
jgi:hypothetical protein